MIEDSGLSIKDFNWMSVSLLSILSFLMISNITYYSFKDFNIRQKVPHISLFAIVLILSFISFDPPLVLFSFFVFYALSGPTMLLIRFIRKRKSLSREKKLL